MFAFTKFSLARQYMLVSFLVMVGGMVVIGLWVSKEIEMGVINRTAAVTALYVDSYISPYVQPAATKNELPPADVQFFDRLMAETALGQQILSLKVWIPNGTIIYSTSPELQGLRYELEDGLLDAFAGKVHTELSELDREEHVLERQVADRLIETYAPVRAAGSDEVIAVMEFYQTTAGLQTEIEQAQYRSWMLVGGVMLIVYLLLSGIVGRASHMILAQQADLQDHVTQLNKLLAQNDTLHKRVRRAAARTTALNEQFLRRISADLHDGPAQDLALALLRFDPLQETCLTNAATEKESITADFRTIHTAIESALKELRVISAGLRLPEIETASPADTIRRAIRDYEQKTQRTVTTTIDPLPPATTLPVKITLYRVIKEALANGYRHSSAQKQHIAASTQYDNLFVEISDSGSGFDTQAPLTSGHLGLATMRERVEVLGGRFAVQSQPGSGTTIRAEIPLQIPEVNYE
ncbi:MAG: sensor histidine kinase [Ardenticatenaceae bacterium]|nr:sensor histidine kinase [Ardenticatenaceae bacterium]